MEVCRYGDCLLSRGETSGVPGHGRISVQLCELPWVPKGRFKQSLIKEGKGFRDKRGTTKKQYYSLGQSPCSISRGTHNNVFELFIEPEPPTEGINLLHSIEDFVVVQSLSPVQLFVTP